MGWDMRSGLQAARGDFIVVIDGDGQNPTTDVMRIYHAHLASGLSATRPIFQESVTTVQAGPLIETNLAGGQPKHSRSVAFGEMATLPAIVQEVLRSPGEPLSPVTRAFMEPRFRQSFADVRLHTDAKAAESACSVNARAFTVGQDVVFGEKSICSP